MPEMIEINLLPKELRKKAAAGPSISLASLPGKQIATGLGGVLAAVHVVLLLLLVWTQADASHLSSKWQKNTLHRQEVDAIKAEKAKLQERVTAFDTITKDQFLWSKKLRQLGDTVTDGVWLTELYVERKGSTLTAPAPGSRTAPSPAPDQLQLVLKGSGAMPDAEGAIIVSRFMENLKANGAFFQDFKEIVSGALQTRKIRDVEIMDFTVSAPLKRQAL